MMKRTILFVDDDQNILDSFRTMLHSKRREWKGHYVLSTEEGLRLVEQKHFDVVITDMRMPGMDGADFLREVERIQPGSIRMILSGYSEMSALLKSVKNAHQFLSKPCSSKTIIGAIQRALDLNHILHDEAIRQVVTQLDSLPVLHDLFVKITNELQSEDPDLKYISKLVERDVGISTTLMKVVNSSFFGFYEKVSSPARAVVLLGVEALKGLILGVQFLKKIDTSGVDGYSVEKLWDHSLLTGCFAKTIAMTEGLDKELVESCFTCGLLHDVGKLVLITKMADQYGPLLEKVRVEGGPVVDMEQRELQVTHAGIGAYLLGLWGFNASVVEGVYGHHSPDQSGEGLTTALIMHVANALQHELVPAPAGYVFSTLNEEWLESQGVMDRVATWREKCMEFVCQE